MNRGTSSGNPWLRILVALVPVLLLVLSATGSAQTPPRTATPTPTVQPYPTSTRTLGPWLCDPDGTPEPENDEVCDDGNDVDGDGCDNNCTPTGCGNGILTVGEACDDGNTAACDGCSPACQGEPGFPCGNGLRDPACGEECDDGNTGPCDGCSADCRIETNVCGDGSLNPDCEECDDGNRSDADACRNDCRPNVCPDGFVNPAAEQCDDGNGDDFDGCTTACTVCPNGVVTPPEACDDANHSNEDACRNDCRPNACGDGYHNPAAEGCDDGNTRSGDGCDANCTPTACGNGIVTAGEACDDGNAVDGDGCDSNCRPTGCGNGVVSAGEQCDDGNRNPFDGCTRTCTLCGDGTITAPEECDDGNREPSDGCTNACTICGNGVVTPPESCDDGNLVDGDGCYAYCATPGCGNAVLEAEEECDDGGVCAGGANEGDVCTGAGSCDSGDCQPIGGDGCAANCSQETAHVLVLDAERASLGLSIVALPDPLRFPVSGRLTLRTGRPHPSEQSGDIPVAIGTGDVRLDPINMPGGLGCLCLAGRQGSLPGTAGTGTIGCGANGLDGVDVTSRIDHDTTDVDPTCADGTVETLGQCVDAACASGTYAGAPCRLDDDCGGWHEGVCNGPEVVTESGAGPAGSALIDLHLVTRHFRRDCSVDFEDPDKGLDGVPCTDDDPFPGGSSGCGFGAPCTFLPLEVRTRVTTGVATAEVVDANALEGEVIAAAATGAAFDCSALLSGQSGDLPGPTLAAAFPALIHGGLGDTATALLLAGTLFSAPCTGDCHGDGRVTIDELIMMVNIALGGMPMSECEAGDVDGDGSMAVNEIVAGVNAALGGCPASPAEQGCLASGGTVTSALCCLETGDFPDTCAIGACGCAPEASHTVRACDCGAERCFDGGSCVRP